MRFKSILVDLDDTLYDYNQSHKPAKLAALLELEKITQRPIFELEKLYRKAQDRVKLVLSGTASCHNRLLYFQTMLELLKMKTTPTALKLYELYWDEFLKNICLRDGVLDFLKFASSNARICIITNLTAEIQYKKLETLKISKYVDFIVTSEEVGKEKPHPKTFSIALNKLGNNIHDVCMIGDDWENDIIVASKLGIESFWLDEYNEEKTLPKQARKFNNFKELTKELK
jgi:HAD superfamily hydrolase (TIGR01549 family)